MWTTVLVLAIAVNFEPTRIGLVPLMLARPRPMLQLSAFLCGSLAISSTVGLLVLFVIHYKLGAPTFRTSTLQIVVGVLALILAAVLATNPGFARKRVASAAFVAEPGAVATAPAPRGMLQKLSAGTQGLLAGSSPWFSGAAGVMFGLPSIETLALLAFIAASGLPPVMQAGAFLTFVLVGHTVVSLPIASYLVAPDKTRALLATVRDWVAGHRRQYIAGLVAVAGCLMVAIGVSGL